ncbi:MAG TPA: hypothetical protein VL358_12415 [Caulobacteraceae bacterium]|jgi:hypothetical protein|nr:hypothetical protein [Caulobacteraceae bacterium]
MIDLIHRRMAVSTLVVGLSLGLGAQGYAAPAKPKPATAASAATAGPPPAGAHLVKLTNTEKQAVTAIYASAPGKNDWGEDLLGKQTAAPGRTVSLTFIARTPEACVQDIQLLMNDGKTVQKNGVNVCDQADYQFKQ